MGIITGALFIAVILLWSRLRKAEQRIARIEEATPVPASISQEPDMATAIGPEPARQPMTGVVLRNSRGARDTARPVADVPPLESEATDEPASPSARDTTAHIEATKGGFEELFGSRLPIWAGGVTLAVAGLFIVKYSIDIGLLSPAVRVVLALLFAALLVVGAETARRWRATAIDPRVSQALAGSGVAAAYAAILVATNLYSLIGQGGGFAALAAITAAALGLALRFGAPSAVLGLAGGLTAPALAGEAPGHVPALVAYLGIAITALAGVARQRRWRWLAYAALGGGFGWGLIILVLRGVDGTGGPALGGYLLLLGFAIPFLAIDRGAHRLIRAAPPAAAALQIALIVAMGGYSALTWGLYGLLAIATIVLASLDRRMAALPLIALVIGLATLLGWERADPAMLAWVTGIGMAIFALPALAMLWRAAGGIARAAQASLALAGGLGAASLACPPGVLSDAAWGGLAILLALPLGASAAIGARGGLEPRDVRFAILATTAMLGFVVGISQIAPLQVVPILYALAIAATVEAARRAPIPDWRGTLIVALMALLAAIARPVAQWLAGIAWTLAGEPLFAGALPGAGIAITHLGIPALIVALAAWRASPAFSSQLSLGVLAGAATIATGAAFILYKQAFGIAGPQDFIARGMAERALFTQALFACGWAAWRTSDRLPQLRFAGIGLTAIAIIRMVVYDMLLFNPLWREQAIGPVPIANLSTVAFLLPLAWLALAARYEPMIALFARRAIIGIQMATVFLWVSAGVRQLYHGSILPPGGIGAGEDATRSFAAILLALAFLGWGIRAGVREWRIASLVLMILAVGKVFLVDAAGLDGLLRIASFVGLGFSLIGIGWLYSRFLKADVRAA